jgi:hypothetical protein
MSIEVLYEDQDDLSWSGRQAKFLRHRFAARRTYGGDWIAVVSTADYQLRFLRHGQSLRRITDRTGFGPSSCECLPLNISMSRQASLLTAERTPGNDPDVRCAASAGRVLGVSSWNPLQLTMKLQRRFCSIPNMFRRIGE